MIRVTVDLCPGGDEEAARHLGTAVIHNDLQQSLETSGHIGSYKVRLSKWGKPKSTWKRGRVLDFARRSRGPWDLLFLSLLDTVGKRNRRHVKKALEEWDKK